MPARDSNGRFVSGGGHVKDRDNGYRALMASAAAAGKGGSLSVGILEKDASQAAEGAKGGITLGDVATWNEFGMGVPERSFIRGWFDETSDANRKTFTQLWQRVLKGQLTPARAFELLGLRFQGDVQKRIVAGIAPPNSPRTIALKGSSTPLVDTGQLKSAISYQVEGV